MKQMLLLLMVVICNYTIKAQKAVWTAKFNGSANGDDVITAMVSDPAGNVYVTGYANNGLTGTDYLTIKYNTNGKRLWVAVYDGPGSGNDDANAICIDRSGNVYVTGLSDALTGAFIDNDAATIKYDTNGHQLWVARYDGGVGRGDAGRAIKTDAVGNIYITGYTSERSGAHSDFNYLTVKYNASGIQQWASIYKGPSKDPNNEEDSANAISIDTKGNVYVTGMSDGDNDGLQNLEEDYLTIKYNAAGVQQWTERYNGTGQQIDEAFSLVIDTKDNVFVTGLSTGSGNKSYDYATLKYDTNGNLKWTRRHNGPAIFSGDFGFVVALDDSDNVIVTGTDQARENNEDIYTVKYSNAGVQQWEARYDGGDNDDPSAMTLDKNNNIYIAGYTTHAATGFDAFVIKYNNSGQQQWTQEFRGSNKYAWDIWNAVAVDTFSNVYVAGYTTDDNSRADYRVIKYSQNNLTINNNIKTQSKTAADFILSQNSPNPFIEETKISFTLQNDNSNYNNVRIWIEDALGKILNILIDKEFHNGTYQVYWNAEHFPAGTYYCKMICNDVLQTKKMIVIK